MKLARRIHLLLGVFFAPSILFFALTGAMQVLELQDGSEGHPPAAFIAHVSEVHVHQKWVLRRRRPEATSQAPAAAAPAPPREAPSGPPPAARPGRTLLKGFVVLMGLGLATTTLLGLYMAWLMPRDRRLGLALLAAGIVIPVAFLMF